MNRPPGRRPRPYDPDTETLELLQQFRSATEDSRRHAAALTAAAERRVETCRRLVEKGLTHRRIAAEVGLSHSAITRLAKSAGEGEVRE